MFDLRDVTFAYAGQLPVFERFSWCGKRGETWAVLGPSGCGKSTLLMLLAGLLHPQSGEVAIAGEPIVRPRPCTGLILQEYGLLPWATVQDNVRLGLRIRRFYGPDGRHVPRDERIDPAEAQTRVAQWLARLGIADVATKYPAQISGGQRQRTAIVRTLVLDPDLVLMDEPFSALDAPTREDLQMLTLTLCAEAAVTVVLVTHNIEEAAFVGQKVLLLGKPPNRKADVLENTHSARVEYRHSTAYQNVCSALRSQVGER
ncbi:MAG TPA: ATP-binding cassette domain-containing protein [Anaerolineae bacterium]|nr:ATP-binding cassette domain-containing protein [Anaerolineae bacterium]HQH39199.1 ATP-binding cassette domain-containing protein [Anaerolineae bacterium]